MPLTLISLASCPAVAEIGHHFTLRPLVRHRHSPPECSRAALTLTSLNGTSAAPFNRQRKVAIHTPPMPVIAIRINGRSPQGICGRLVSVDAGNHQPDQVDQMHRQDQNRHSNQKSETPACSPGTGGRRTARKK